MAKYAWMKRNTPYWQWRAIAVLSVLLVIILLVGLGVLLQKQGESSSEGATRSADTSSFLFEPEAANSLCSNCQTCVSLSECKDRHPGRDLRDLTSCHRGGVCCPLYSGKEAPLSCHQRYHLLPRPGSCGMSSVPRNPKISQGSQGLPGQYPWMALLGTKRNNSGRESVFWSCGATLINDRYVLTAAHCVDNNRINIDVVRLREHNLLKDAADDCFEGECIRGPPVDLGVEEVVVHDLWATTGKKTLKHDIALLRLDRRVPITFEKSIFPICLPLEPDDVPVDNGRTYEIAGWGTNGDMQMKKMSDMLLFEYIKGRSLEDCNTCLPGSAASYCPLTQGQICVQGDYGIDVCEGDSGGPLMAFDVHETWQAGITSFSPLGCGLNSIPSIFTNVSSYTSWILDNIEP